MKENFLHFLSNENCLLYINGKVVGLIDNQNNFEIDIITKTNNIFVTYFPTINNSNTIPYTFTLETTNTPNTENNYIKIVPFPNNHYDIIMNPFYYYQLSESKIILNENVGRFFVSIISDTKSRITIFSGSSIVFNIQTTVLTNAKSYIKNETLIIEGTTEKDDEYYLLVINTSNFTIIHNDISQSIEENNDFIQSYKKLDNISKNAEITKISFDNNSKETYYVYQNDYPTPPSAKELIPLSFLQSLIIGDENCAKNHLSDNFCNSTINQISSYFGKIKEIYLNRHTLKQGIINYTILSDNYKNYDFIIENNKIIEIKQVF